MNPPSRPASSHPRNVTLHDVAKALEITHVTVHNALNDKGRMSPELRERVKAKAREMGYAPHPLARGLRSGRAHALGVLVYQLNSRLSPAQLAGVEEAAQDRGYNVVVAAHKYQPERALEILRDMTARRLDGVVAISSITNLLESVAVQLPTLGVPYVYSFQEPPSGMPADGVTVDQEGGAYEATKYLIGLGRQRIGFISGPETRTAAVRRLAGYKRAMREAGREIVPERIVLAADFEVPDGLEAAQRLLVQAPDVDAVFASADLMAAGLIRVLRRQGRRIPEDVAIVGFDDLPMSDAVDPPLTTMRMPLEEIGRRSAHRLIDRIEGLDDGMPWVERLPCQLVVRESA